MDIPATGWRLPDDACALLAHLVAEHRPELIVECGSGRSTVVLAQAARDLDCGDVVALEHDPAFALETRQLLDDARLDADVRWARLTDGWYDRRDWGDLHDIGMLVVDGPPGWSPDSRAPALPLLRDRLLPGCVVVLDDVDRPGEKQIMADWGIPMTLFKHAKATLGYGIFDG
jgi:predicted O-methyltransferase YrrM